MFALCRPRTWTARAQTGHVTEPWGDTAAGWSLGTAGRAFPMGPRQHLLLALGCACSSLSPSDGALLVWDTGTAA